MRHDPPEGFIALIRQFPQFAAERDGEVVLADEGGKVEGFFPSYPQALAAGYAKFGLGQFLVVDITASTVANWARWLARHDDVEAEYGSWDNRLMLALHAPERPDGEGYPFSWIEPRLREIGHDDIANAVRQMRATWLMAQESEEFHKGKRIEAEAALAALATPSQAPEPTAAKALEFAEYMAKGGEQLLESINNRFAAVEARDNLEGDEGEDVLIAADQRIDRAEEALSDYMRGFSADIYEFRKRAAKVGPSQAVASALQAAAVPAAMVRYLQDTLQEGTAAEKGIAKTALAMLAAAPAHPVVQPGAGGSAPAPVPAGDAAMVALRRALDAAQVPSGYRADIIGFFCNEWNAALSKQMPAGDAVALAADAERYRVLRRSTGNEIVGSNTPGTEHLLVIRLNVTGCERLNASGAVDFGATMDATLDDERRIQTSWDAAISREGQADPVQTAWKAGLVVQYFQLNSYDGEWTDYRHEEAPGTNSSRLHWRVKPGQADSTGGTTT